MNTPDQIHEKFGRAIKKLRESQGQDSPTFIQGVMGEAIASAELAGAETEEQLKATTTTTFEKMTTLKEEIAKLLHLFWEEWSLELSKKELLSENRLNRWNEFWVEYDLLPEKIKQLDRIKADKILSLIRSRLPKENRSWTYILLPLNWNKEREQGFADGYNSCLKEIKDLLV